MKTFRRFVSTIRNVGLSATIALTLLAALAMTNVGTNPVLASRGDNKADSKADKPDKADKADKGWKDAGRDASDKGSSGGKQMAGDPKGNVG